MNNDIIDINARDNEIERLRFEKHWKLQRIADKFGISRQRVQQIIGKSGHLYHAGKREFIISHPEMTNEEIAEIYGVSPKAVGDHRRNMRYKITGGPPAQGRKWEDWAIERLEEMGLFCQPQIFHSPYDILVNDEWRVEVKSTSSDVSTYDTDVPWTLPTWRFSNINKEEHDFLVCVIIPCETAYIIPAEELPPQSASIFIPHSPSGRERNTKYAEFEEAWHLICDATRN